MAIGGVLFDIDGVLVTSWKPIEGASKTLRTLSDHQIACSYLTNTTTKWQFTSYERDAESGNDYAVARYQRRTPLLQRRPQQLRRIRLPLPRLPGRRCPCRRIQPQH